MELTLPMNYVELEQDEMMYLDGGWSVTISRKTINETVNWLHGSVAVTALKFLSNKYQIGQKIVSMGIGFAKGLLAKAGFGSFLAASLGFALAGVIAASALTIGTIYLFDKSVTLGF